MNKQLFKEVGITEDDYKSWCIKNKKTHYKKEVKEEFFKLIQDNKIIKDIDGNLIKKEE